MATVSFSDNPSPLPRNEIPLNQTQVGIASKVWHVVSKIIDMLASAVSYFQQVSIDKDIQEREEVMQIKPNLYATIDKLRNKSTLGEDAITDYCDFLKERGENFELIDHFLFGNGSLDDEWHGSYDNPNSNLVFIPVVFEGRFRDHIAAVIYDRENTRIEYYDSKGLTSTERENDTIKGGGTITELLKEVNRRAGSNAEFVENTSKHQYDSHNCGVYVLRYLERRLGGEEPSAIFEDGESFWTINSDTRRDMITALADQYLNVAQEPQQRIEAMADDGFEVVGYS